jgi:hypothetical protein
LNNGLNKIYHHIDGSDVFFQISQNWFGNLEIHTCLNQNQAKFYIKVELLLTKRFFEKTFIYTFQWFLVGDSVTSSLGLPMETSSAESLSDVTRVDDDG